MRRLAQSEEVHFAQNGKGEPMSLLEDIQAAVIQTEVDTAPILLKLRLLAARLGSAPLEEWVKHESEGYPANATVPDYRLIGVTYTATFFGSFGSGISNAPVPPYLVEKFAGAHWNQQEIRQSISAIDDLVKGASSGTLQINAANMILLLQGKMYPDYNCSGVTGTISRAALVELQHAVRSRVLELTIQLEKSVPGAADISFSSKGAAAKVNAEQVTQITNQTIYGNVTSIASSGAGASFNIAVQQGDRESFVQALVKAGIPEGDASDLATIVASEPPESKDEPFGRKAAKWIGDNLKKAAGGTWKMGVSVATEVLKQAALKYYGL